MEITKPLLAWLRAIRSAPTLTKLLVVGIPIAGVITYTVVAPGYRHSRPAPASDSRPIAAPASDSPATGLSAESRNATRLTDLATLQDAFEEYHSRVGSYPSTGGKLQTLCTYEALDAGCKLATVLASIPGDPMGKNLGYFLVSDGTSYTIVSQWEGNGAPPSEYSCPSSIIPSRGQSKLACLGN